MQTFFFGSRDGITIAYPGIQVTDNYEVTERNWYKRALSNPSLIMSSPGYSDAFITNQNVVTFSKAIQLDDSEHTIIGVAGVDITYGDIGDIIDNITFGGCSQEGVECFIIDKYGYLFYDSVSNEQSSQFLGKRKGTLVKSLLDNGLIARKTKVTPFMKCGEGGDSGSQEEGDDEGEGESCVSVETYYEVSENVTSAGMTIDIFDTCMQGEYTMVHVSQTNLYMIVFRGTSGYCAEKNAIVPSSEPSENYWCESYLKQSERYSGQCASAVERECVTECPGGDEDDALMYCGGTGDCINGMCVCDAGFEGGVGGSCLVMSDARRVHGTPFVSLVLTLLVVAVVTMLMGN